MLLAINVQQIEIESNLENQPPYQPTICNIFSRIRFDFDINLLRINIESFTVYCLKKFLKIQNRIFFK